MKGYLLNLLAAIKRSVISMDKTEAAVFLNAPNGESVSLYSAQQAEKGKRWACVICKGLSILVQKDHCKKQLAGQPMTWLNYLRAAVLVLIPFFAFRELIHEFIRYCL